jgi:hypothetical protein
MCCSRLSAVIACAAASAAAAVPVDVFAEDVLEQAVASEAAPTTTIS